MSDGLAPTSVAGTSAEARSIARTVLAKLPRDSGVRGIALVEPPQALVDEDGSQVQRGPDDVWVESEFLPARDDAARVRRWWLNAIIVSTMWRKLGALGVHVVGGSVSADDVSDAIGSPEAARFDIGSDADEVLFRDGANDRESSMEVDRATLDRRIAEAASTMGLRIARVEYWGIDGTIVEIEATADDPVAFLRDHRDTYFYGDNGRLEGRSLVVRGGNGKLVFASSYSRGMNAGSGWASSADAAGEGRDGATVPTDTGVAESIPYDEADG